MDVLTGPRYGVVMLFNSASAFLTAQNSVFGAVLRQVRGEPQVPVGSVLPPAAVDLLLAALSLVAIALGVTGVAHARRWTERRKPMMRRLLASLPLIVILVISSQLPSIGGVLVGGRDSTWRAVAYGWPALTAFVLAAALAAAATLLTRAVLLGAAALGSDPELSPPRNPTRA